MKEITAARHMSIGCRVLEPVMRQPQDLEEGMQCPSKKPARKLGMEQWVLFRRFVLTMVEKVL